MLWVEPSAACNLDCADCPTAAGRLGGVMSLDGFMTVLDRIPRSVRLLNLWHRGEPLVAKHFPDIVAAASERGIKTQTHSNGILLARGDLAQRIVKSKLTRISIGVDGSDQATYAKYRIGGTLSEVGTGVRKLVSARGKLRHPQINVECLLGRQSSEHLQEIKDMVSKWGVDEVKFKTLRVSDLTNVKAAQTLLPDDDKLWRYRKEGENIVPNRRYSRCLRVMWSAVVAYNGDVLPCCFDSEGKHTLGNIFEQEWRSIWKGQKFSEFRKVVMSNSDDRPTMCGNCTEGLKRLYLPGRLVLR